MRNSLQSDLIATAIDTLYARNIKPTVEDIRCEANRTFYNLKRQGHPTRAEFTDCQPINTFLLEDPRGQNCAREGRIDPNPGTKPGWFKTFHPQAGDPQYRGRKSCQLVLAIKQPRVPEFELGSEVSIDDRDLVAYLRNDYNAAADGFEQAQTHEERLYYTSRMQNLHDRLFKKLVSLANRGGLIRDAKTVARMLTTTASINPNDHGTLHASSGRA